jgi:PAS domain-containing protein/CheY-like chemotaxis protein
MGLPRGEAQPAGRNPARASTVEAGEEHFLFEANEPFLRSLTRDRARPLLGRGRLEDRVVPELVERFSSPLQRILDLLPQAAAILDSHGAVLHANAVLARLCGVSPEAWGEMPLEWHLSDDSRRAFRSLRQQMRRDGRAATLRVRLRSNREERFLSACLLTPLPDAGLFVMLDQAPVSRVAGSDVATHGPETGPMPRLDTPPKAEVSAQEATSTAEAPVAPAPTRRTIVVLEEQAPLRETLVRMLGLLGYQAEPVDDPEACFAMLRRGEPLDGLLFDPWRGGAAGARCLERIVELRPELPLVAYCAEGDGAEPLWAPGVQAVLSRPTSLAELYEAWQAVFEGRTSGSAWMVIPLRPLGDSGSTLS